MYMDLHLMYTLLTIHYYCIHRIKEMVVRFQKPNHLLNKKVNKIMPKYSINYSEIGTVYVTIG